MGWMNDLKQNLNIASEKHLLYVNFAPINQATVVSKNPVVFRSEACFKYSKKHNDYILCIESNGNKYWLTSYLSNYKIHIKGKHELRYSTVYGIGGNLKNVN